MPNPGAYDRVQVLLVDDDPELRQKAMALGETVFLKTL